MRFSAIRRWPLHRAGTFPPLAPPADSRRARVRTAVITSAAAALLLGGTAAVAAAGTGRAAAPAAPCPGERSLGRSG
jgi:hypothetical protein